MSLSFFRGLDASAVYLGVILIMLLAMKLKLVCASYLVVGMCSGREFSWTVVYAVLFAVYVS